MAETKYTYSIATDTLNGIVALAELEVEINDDTTTSIDVSRILATGDVLDVYMVSALSAPQKTGLDAVLAAHDGVVIPAANKNRFPISWSFGGTTKAYVSTTSGSYVIRRRVVFPGTDIVGVPINLFVLASVLSGTGKIKIYDKTNGVTVCELTGIANTTFQIKNLGTISSLPETKAVFELQMETTATVACSLLYMEF